LHYDKLQSVLRSLKGFTQDGDGRSVGVGSPWPQGKIIFERFNFHLIPHCLGAFTRCYCADCQPIFWELGGTIFPIITLAGVKVEINS
jgi:hypothetical protein